MRAATRKGVVRYLAAFMALFAAVTLCRADDCAKRTSKLVDLSSYIVAARVMEVGVAPGFWSGVTPAIQDVQYELLQSYKGDPGSKQFTVEHRVVKGSRLTEKHPPGLSKAIFAPGKEVIVFLQSPKLAIGDECAVQLRSAALENQLRDLLHTK